MTHPFRLGMLTVLCLISILSCKPPDSELTPATTQTTGPVAVGSGNGFSFDQNDFFANVVPPDGMTVYTHLDGDWTQPCKVAAGTTGKDIRCIVEVEEFDLYFLGLKLNFNVPSSTCAYSKILPYYYYRYPAGIGPTNVQITLDADGVGTVTSPAGGIGLTTIIAANGSTPVCNRDYTPVSGPNCCQGKYVLDVVDNAGAHTYSTGDWGGKIGNCLNGPAVDSQKKNDSNIPQATIVFTNNQTLNTQYEIPSPYVKGYSTNVYAANYFNGGGSDYSLASSPTPMQGPAALGVPAQPWYEIDCLDHSEDRVNRIYIMVRSWTANSEFSKKSSGDFTLGGAEGVPFSDHLIFDRPGWVGAIGFGNNYPAGSD